MSKSGIILEYHGYFDLSVMELLLGKIRKTTEFASLNKTANKRVYGALVECLENINKHSYLKPTDDERMQPSITVRKVDDKIIIIAGNMVSRESRIKLSRRLDQLNQSDEIVLHTMYKKRINRNLKYGENLAGLGLIDIAIKTGNKITYSFNSLSKDYLYFEIQISINI